VAATPGSSLPVSEAPAPEFLDALRALGDGLRVLNVPWMIIGGVAVIAHGVPRYTADVDATVTAPHEPLQRIFDVFAQNGIVPRIADALPFARDRQVMLLRHAASGVDLDVDLVIYKLVAARPRDLDDVERLLLLHGPSLDVERIVATVREFADALEDTGRVDALERLLKKTGLWP
jgi:Nucleotidyltransferase of unknown function (DUF6036)